MKHIISTILLFNKPYTKQIQKTIDIPLHTWVLGASGLLCPGNSLKCWLNVVIPEESLEEKITEKRVFIIACHDDSEMFDIDNLMHISTFDIEDETYSVFEVLDE